VKDLLKSRLNRFTMTHGQDSLTVSLTHNYLGVPGQTESAFAGVLVRTVKSILYQLILKRCVISEWLSTMSLSLVPERSHVKISEKLSKITFSRRNCVRDCAVALDYFGKNGCDWL